MKHNYEICAHLCGKNVRLSQLQISRREITSSQPLSENLGHSKRFENFHIFKPKRNSNVRLDDKTEKTC